ncbi:hypothetical protein OFC53_30950, partial [Escherichia coli]|nr:hypothetical protein [Escherichia coli]
MNVDIEYLSSLLNYSPVRDFHIELVKHNGFYIASPDESRLYGDIIPERSQFNFSNMYPDIWSRVVSEQAGYS